MKNNKLKELRTKNNLSLTQLSKLVNIDISRLSKFENHQVGLREDNLKILSDYFNVSISHLLGLDESIENTNIDNNSENLIINHILKELKQLNDDDLILIKNIVDRLSIKL